MAKQIDLWLHLEIQGGRDVVSAEKYSELQDDLADVLGESGFEVEGSDFGVLGMGLGAVGRTLTPITMKNIEAVITTHGFSMGPGPEEFVVIASVAERA